MIAPTSYPFLKYCLQLMGKTEEEAIAYEKEAVAHPERYLELLKELEDLVDNDVKIKTNENY